MDHIEDYSYEYYTDTTWEDNLYGYDTVSSRESELEELLGEIVNTPTVKIPLWIVQNKKRLKELGIKIKEVK